MFNNKNMPAKGGSASGGKLLMITRKVDKNDALAGFTWNWVKKIGENLDKLYVISWQAGDKSGLPANVEVFFLPNGKIKKIFILWYELIKLLPKVDGLFCHMNSEYTILSAPLAKIFGKRTVSWYTHKQVNWKRRLVELLADKILTASKDSFRRPWFKNKIEVTGHGIDVERFFSTSQAHQTSAYRLLTIGRISPSKDYESMIKAVAILKKQGINIELNIIGDIGLANQRIYYQELMAMVDKMELKENVKFIGAIPNNRIRQYLWQSEVFINLSYTGSLDKAILEAMASGIIVLTSNEAFKDILPSELMVEKDNPLQLAEKIKWVVNLSDNDEIAMRKKLEQEVRNNHNLDNLVLKIINQFA